MREKEVDVLVEKSIVMVMILMELGGVCERRKLVY